MKNLIFDLDGTLLDSAPGIVVSLTHAVRALGHDFTPYAGITHLLGPPMSQVMAQLRLQDRPGRRVVPDTLWAVRHHWISGLYRN